MARRKPFGSAIEQNAAHYWPAYMVASLTFLIGRTANIRNIMPVRNTLPRLLSALVLTPILAATAQSAPKSDPHIPEILHSLHQVKNIRETEISPDGNFIAWMIRDEGIYLAPISDSAQARHVTACAAGQKGKENSIAWSPDSKTLAFLSDCTPDKKIAVFTYAAATSAAPHLLAQLNGYAEALQYSPNGKYLSFLYVDGATRPSGALAAMKPPSGVIGVEDVEIQRVAVVATSDNGTVDQITPANLHVYEFDWSSDSTRLAYVAAPPPGEDNWWTAKLYTESLVKAIEYSGSVRSDRVIGQTPQVVFDPNTTTGSLHGLQIAVPRFSPDGSKIAFIGGLMSDQGSTGGDAYLISSSGGDATNITPARDASPAWLTWIDDHNLGVSETSNGASHLFVYDTTTQQESSDHSLTLPDSIGAGTLEMRVSISNANTIALIRSSFDHPPEIWIGPLDNLKQFTHLNDSLKPFWGKSESVDWDNEGFHVQGWLLYPADYDPAKKYPLVVYVHGGPAAANLPRWPGADFGPAPLAALGYFVLMPNPRGSFGEGEKFTQANRKDFGYGDLRDILAGVDTVIKNHPVDPNRIGITGWSYGGFMTMFAVTQTNRFHAAVAGAGLSDWESYYGENSIDEWMIPYFGASVYDDPAAYAKSSAINYIKNAKTPTLVVVGDRDGECPAPQSFEFWHALRDEHVPTQLVVYPNEGHGFTDPEHRVDVLQRALDWFDQHMPQS
jgi:dipeptidyl aminopeptidase/acylaminoacyl peptidase